ncbi:MAG: aldehyde dehydrogenase family protein [Planctomycetota bacterium]
MSLEDKDLKSIQEARNLLSKAGEAQKVYARFSQTQVDRITGAVVRAGLKAAESLAKIAVEESGFGVYESKIIKNRFATQYLWEDIRELKTVGVISRDDRKGVLEIAEPYGVILGIVPITNPTSTALFKGIIALKTRNAIVFSPHPRGVRCIGEASRIMEDAARGAGAPAGLVQCMTHVSMEGINEAMHHPVTALILATGGNAMVKAAYSAGKPAYGVGPGNAPAFIERTARIPLAVKAIVMSQTFDNGTICASEQSVIIDRVVKDRVLREFASQGAYLCNEGEKKQLEKIISKNGGLNSDIVGQYPYKIAAMAGFAVPRETTVLLAEESHIGPEYPLSIEKLSPILAIYYADGWEKGCELCIDLLRLGGMGHTMAIHSTNEEVIMRFALEKPVNRILVNAPTSQGAIGFATGLVPSMTLGCGAHGGNITSDNVSARNLILIKRLARVKPGIVEGFELSPRSSYRSGHTPLGGDSLPDSRVSEVSTTDWTYRNDLRNAPGNEPVSFSLPSLPLQPGNSTAQGKNINLNHKCESDVPPERCPLGEGCDRCGQ